MTREEAIKLLVNATYSDEWQGNEDLTTAYHMAIQALEHPVRNVVAIVPCGDTISRQAVLDQTYLWSKDEFLRVTNPFDYLRKRIEDLPLVNPQSKTGHWIENISKYPYVSYRCSECGNMHLTKTNYCDQCGIKMIEPQERNNKE